MSDNKKKIDPLLEEEGKKVEAPLAKVKPIQKDPILLTKEKLESAPQINFIIPMFEGEGKCAFETVTINGYKTDVPKGKMVTIPLPVANILAEKYKIAMEVGKDFRVDRADNVNQALS